MTNLIAKLDGILLRRINDNYKMRKYCFIKNIK